MIGNNMKQFRNNKNVYEHGIAIYIAVIITATLILVSFSILSLALKQISISGAGRDSQDAFYAADSGAECALFWDVHNPVNPAQSAFDPLSIQTITCNNISIPVIHTVATSTFTMLFTPDLFCAKVTVVKLGLTTKVESRGYNTCDTTSNRRLERAVQINY